MKTITAYMKIDLTAFFVLSIALHVVVISFAYSPAMPLLAFRPAQVSPSLQLSFTAPMHSKISNDNVKETAKPQREEKPSTQNLAPPNTLQANLTRNKRNQTTENQVSNAKSKSGPIVRSSVPQLNPSSEFVKFLSRSEISQTSDLMIQATHSLEAKRTTDMHQTPTRQAQQNARMVVQRLNIAISEYFNYPRVAQRNGWQGIVKLGLRIEPNGQLSQIRVVSTSGFPVLDRAALDTLHRITVLREVQRWLNGKHFDAVLPVEYKLLDG